MTITVLGSGGSTPTPQRSLPSVAVHIEGDVLLLDCGEGAQRQMMRLGVSYAKVKAIFISHLHLDHFLGVFGLMETLRLNGRTEPVEVFAPPGARRALTALKPMPLLVIHEVPAGFGAGKPLYSLNEHDVYAVDVSHGPTPALGFVVRQRERLRFHEAKAKKLGLAGPLFTQIQKEGKVAVGKKTVKLADVTYSAPGRSIAYSGDTTYCPALVKASKEADLLIHESTFCEGQRDLAVERHHSTAGDAARVAKEAGVKKLLLTHLSGRFSESSDEPLKEAKAVFKEVEVATDGWKLELK